MFLRVLLSAFVFILYSPLCNADSVTFIAEDLPPYHFKNQQGEVSGALVDIAKAVVKQTNLTANFEIMPMARVFKEHKTNTNAIMLSLLKTPERINKYTWLGEVYFADAYLISLKSHVDEVVHLNFAKEYKVATIRGYLSEAYLKQKGFTENNNLILVSYYNQLWQMLYKNRIDFVVTNTLTLNNELKSLGLDPSLITKRIHLSDLPSSLNFAASNQLNPKTAKALSDALSNIKENGEYHAILNKWQLLLPNTTNMQH
ncbi:MULTISPECIES: substrate-binding periplasmic protein [Pseudoalteromonas]|uniref:substrate-binding periplasmic protein n=1 Tax=Pseudoalteromonas TaxID=53246 RepID=UPI0002317D4A|nr:MULTISPECIES: transporter substrate-binding domain-containing protein [Pseudoalteromonas]MBG9991455.1 transporter substrate-binding domain-containing protein [Pseudoalteromonas sp. NZS37]MBH0080421.1 transporter substrate-binding domain-containing protein [Pseudoalteromonas sp. NZS11]PLT24537.1 amino acid ABC transporter substrate-binding protein [Pseudoalteromonas sp. MelDa3]GAA69874.1 amino acid ABC transporter substrate-binding protein [Pseudoalteromonas sp. BSi20429]